MQLKKTVQGLTVAAFLGGGLLLAAAPTLADANDGAPGGGGRIVAGDQNGGSPGHGGFAPLVADGYQATSSTAKECPPGFLWHHLQGCIAIPPGPRGDNNGAPGGAGRVITAGDQNGGAPGGGGRIVLTGADNGAPGSGG